MKIFQIKVVKTIITKNVRHLLLQLEVKADMEEVIKKKVLGHRKTIQVMKAISSWVQLVEAEEALKTLEGPINYLN